MCGRYSFSTSKEKLKKQFGDIDLDADLQLSYNVAPTQRSYVITNEEPHRLNYYVWGLLPHWSKDGQVTGRLINARCEGIESKPSFRVPLRRRRCWVLADSFYEWRHQGSRKIPYRIRPKEDQLLVMAGIWDVWRKPDQEVFSFSIITGPPNREVAPLHDRMPVLLTTTEQQERWLLTDDLDEALDLLVTAPDGLLELYRVPEALNNPRNNSPELHERVPEEEGGAMEFEF